MGILKKNRPLQNMRNISEGRANHLDSSKHLQSEFRVQQIFEPQKYISAPGEDEKGEPSECQIQTRTIGPNKVEKAEPEEAKKKGRRKKSTKAKKWSLRK